MDLIASVAAIWKNSETLCRLVPFEKVYTGRVPDEDKTKFPYVSIEQDASSRWKRSNQARYTKVSFSFHIWVHDTKLAEGCAVESAISDVYADEGWCFDGGKVMDVLDDGKGKPSQVSEPTYHAWDIEHTCTLCVETARVGKSLDTCDCTSGQSDDSWSSSSSSSGTSGQGESDSDASSGSSSEST
jgi:hypothetical protein